MIAQNKTVVLGAALFVIGALSAPRLCRAETYTVKMGSDQGQLSFEPSRLTIKPGDTVKFVNNKLAPHNVVFDTSGVPGSSKEVAKALSRSKLLMNPGESTEVQFPTDAVEGVYKFYCSPHRGAGEVGAITVKK